MMQVTEFEGGEDSDDVSQVIGMLVGMHWAEPHQKAATQPPSESSPPPRPNPAHPSLLREGTMG